MSPEVQLPIDGGHLRVLTPDDVHTGYVLGLNDPEINRYLDSVKCTAQTIQGVRDFVNSSFESPNSVMWGIWNTSAEYHYGTVRLHGINPFHKTAHIGICIFDKRLWGRHLGSKAISAVTKWAIEHLDLRWIEAGAYAEHFASQRAFLTAGYSWVYDIPGKFLLNGMPATVKVYVARND
jgi:ribosomal-protein-alanine N-acetyltransferase